MKIIAVDNFDRDGMPEKLIAESIPDPRRAAIMCDALNGRADKYGDWFYRVVKDDYALATGEP